jgi:hypothetical protein
MGQAKIRREALRQQMLDKSKEWDFPPSPWEVAVCVELKEEDVVVIQRAPANQLAWARMPANKCHANASWYAKNDRSGKAKAVVGWWVQWPNFVLHSVVEIDGALICMTPSQYNEAGIPFIPDPKISWIEDGEVYSAVRNGQVVGPGVRMFPAFTMAQNAIVRERLLAGVDPLKAGDFTDEEMAELERQYIEGPSKGANSAAMPLY